MRSQEAPTPRWRPATPCHSSRSGRTSRSCEPRPPLTSARIHAASSNRSPDDAAVEEVKRTPWWPQHRKPYPYRRTPNRSAEPPEGYRAVSLLVADRGNAGTSSAPLHLTSPPLRRPARQERTAREAAPSERAAKQREITPSNAQVVDRVGGEFITGFSCKVNRHSGSATEQRSASRQRRRCEHAEEPLITAGTSPAVPMTALCGHSGRYGACLICAPPQEGDDPEQHGLVGARPRRRTPPAKDPPHPVPSSHGTRLEAAR